MNDIIPQILGMGFLAIALVWVSYTMEKNYRDNLSRLRHMIDEDQIKPSYKYNVYEHDNHIFVRDIETKQIRVVR